MDAETIKLLEDQMDSVMDLVIKMVPRFGKVYRGLYDSLIEEGFNSEQAMQIVANYRPELKS